MLMNEYYKRAIEQMLEIEVPLRAQYIRTMFDEITRIMNHLMCGCNSLTSVLRYLYAFRERELRWTVMKRFRRACACNLLSAWWGCQRSTGSHAQI